MSERPFMQLYTSDFIGDTLHLSTEQVGAYMLLLMAMWNAKGSLPSCEIKLARVARMSVKKWRAIAADLLPFFTMEGDKITHDRLTKELQKSESKSQSRASAGAKGGRSKSLKNKEPPLAIASDLQQHLPDTITIKDSSSLHSEESEKKNNQKKIPDIYLEFEKQFWPIYPRKVGKGQALKAFSKARKIADLETILNGVRRYADSRHGKEPEFTRHAATWLNGLCWEDEGPVDETEQARRDIAEFIRRHNAKNNGRSSDYESERTDQGNDSFDWH